MPTMTDGAISTINETTAVLVIPANPARLFYSLRNTDASATYRIKFGSAAVSDQGLAIGPDDTWFERIDKERLGDEEDGSQQDIYVIADTGSGSGLSLDWAEQIR